MYIADFDRIKNLISKTGLSYAEFADKVGSSYSMIGHIVKGIRQPSINLLKRIANYFNLTADELIVKIYPSDNCRRKDN